MSRIDAALGAISTDRVVEIATRIIATPQPDGAEGQVAELIAGLLDQPRIEVDLEPVVAGRPNVVARVRGGGQGPSLLLTAHMDCGVAPSGWRHDPSDAWIVDGKLFGGGLTDMHGGLAAMVAAVEAAARIEPLPGDLVLLAVMHHDTIGLGAKYAFASRGGWPRYGICGEPSSLQIHTGNGGAVKFEIAITGKLAHISRHEEGVDTLPVALEIYRGLRELRFTFEPHPRLPDLPRFLVGELHAGSAPGSVADRAVIRGDVRTVPSMTVESVRADLRRAIERGTRPGITTQLRTLGVQIPFIGATEGPLVDALRAAHRQVRREEAVVTSALPGQSFVADASDMAAHGIETVVYGPCDWHYAPNEWVATEELGDAARIYLTAALRLMGVS
jgi:acetylornithine deacetylase/succinyl-diaminopimelate desuccinylase-like protein